MFNFRGFPLATTMTLSFEATGSSSSDMAALSSIGATAVASWVAIMKWIEMKIEAKHDWSLRRGKSRGQETQSSPGDQSDAVVVWCNNGIQTHE